MSNSDHWQRIERALREENRRRLRAERVVRKQNQALASTVELITRQPALPDFIEATLRTIVREFGGMWAALWVIDEDTNDLRRIGSYCISAEVREILDDYRIRHADEILTFAGRLFPMLRGHRNPIVVRATHESISPRNTRLFSQLAVRSVVVSPFWVGSRLIGWVSLFSALEVEDPDKIAFVSAISQQIALALHVAKLRDVESEMQAAHEREAAAQARERERAVMLRALDDTSRVLDDFQGMHSVLIGILESLAGLFDSPDASLWIPREPGDIPLPLVVIRNGKSRVISVEARRAAQTRLGKSAAKKLAEWTHPGRGHLIESGLRPSVKNLLRGALGVQAPCAKQWLVMPVGFAEHTLGFALIAQPEDFDEGSDRILVANFLTQQAALALRMETLSKIQRRASLARERARISRDLHDLLAQSLSGIVLQIEAIRHECPGIASEALARMDKIREQAGRSVEEVRRTLHMLRPVMLAEHSLRDALSALAAEAAANARIDVTFECQPDDLIVPAEWEQHLFAIASEALNNALRHARASKIRIRLSQRAGVIRLKISDNGRGLSKTHRRTKATNGHGLKNMRERAGFCGGEFKFESGGNGTTVRIVCPL